MKLTGDRKETLQDMLLSASWPVLLEVIEDIVNNYNANVLKQDLSQGDRQLVIEAARAEGARRLFQNIKEIKKRYLKAETGL